jgi:hypothetical protein
MTLCQAPEPDALHTGWYCTRPRGHAGDHIATIGPYRDGEVILAQWPASPEPEVDRIYIDDLDDPDGNIH